MFSKTFVTLTTLSALVIAVPTSAAPVQEVSRSEAATGTNWIASFYYGTLFAGENGCVGELVGGAGGTTDDTPSVCHNIVEGEGGTCAEFVVTSGTADFPTCYVRYYYKSDCEGKSDHSKDTAIGSYINFEMAWQVKSWDVVCDKA